MRALTPTLAALWAVGLALGCFEESRDFAEEDELLDLRVLAIRAEPADVVPGETVVLTPLLYVPPGDEVSYQWELCVVTQGADEAFACDNEALGLPAELLELFDLGTEPQAEVSYLVDAEELRAQCEEALEALDVVEDFVTLPDCDAGFDLNVRLTVETAVTERIAIRSLLFWFEEPTEAQRNANPEIAGLRLNPAASGSSSLTEPPESLAAAPEGDLAVQVVVDQRHRETFVPRSDAGAEPREEALVFSWFSTHGRWDRDGSFADGVNFDLDEAGRNRLGFDDQPGDEGELVVVMRDRRGGVAWLRQALRIVEPTGSVVAPPSEP